VCEHERASERVSDGLREWMSMMSAHRGPDPQAHPYHGMARLACQGLEFDPQAMVDIEAGWRRV